MKTPLHELLTPGYFLLIASVPRGGGRGEGVPTQGRVQGIPELMVPYVGFFNDAVAAL